MSPAVTPAIEPVDQDGTTGTTGTNRATGPNQGDEARDTVRRAFRSPIGGAIGEAILPFVLARIVVLGALGLAHFIVDRANPSTAGVGARVRQAPAHIFSGRPTWP